MEGTKASKQGTTSSKASFFALPAECRVEIYQEIFSGVKPKLKLDSAARHTLRKWDGLENKLRLLSFFDNRNNLAIMFTNHQVLNEAIELLAKATTLKVTGTFGRADPMALLSAWFPSLVPRLEVDFAAFVHIDREKLSSLKEVVFVQQVEGINSGTEDGFHMLTCGVCGGKNSCHYISDVMEDVKSWGWFKDQFLLLSKEAGWQAYLSTRIDYGVVRYDENEEPRVDETYIEALTDLETMKPVQKLGVFKGEELDLDTWLVRYKKPQDEEHICDYF